MIIKNNKLWAWVIGLVVVAIWVGFILLMGATDGETSVGASSKIAEFIHRQLTEYSDHAERPVEEIDLIIRKLAHFIEYLLLGTMVFVVFSYLSKRWWLIYLLTLAVCVPVPFLDEGIQAATSGRTSHLLDVWIDLSGLLMAVIIGSIFGVRKKKEKITPR